MDEWLLNEVQESEEEWADIERLKRELEKKSELRTKKDERIIREFCAKNKYADIIRTLELLEKNQGIAKWDREIVQQFKEKYPNELTVPMIQQMMDVKDLYREYLESGGECDD